VRGRRARALRLRRVLEILFESVAHGEVPTFIVKPTFPGKAFRDERKLANDENLKMMMMMARGWSWSHSVRRLGRLAGRRDGFRGG
jgi:hypothetical protein